MEAVVFAAWITGGATVLASIIGVLGIGAIFKNRKLVVRLCREIEVYHRQEGFLVKNLIKGEGKEPTATLIQQRRGAYRTDSDNNGRPSMTEREARKIRERFFWAEN